MEPKKWEIKQKEKIYDTGFMQVYAMDCELPDEGKKHIFTSVGFKDWVIVMAVKKEDLSIITVKQHRLGTDEITTELPAGAVDKGEDTMTAAQRELLEETGYTSNTWIRLHSMNVNPAVETNQCHFYLALNCEKTGNQDLDPDEYIIVESVARDKYYPAMFSNSLSVLCAYMAEQFLDYSIKQAKESAKNTNKGESNED
ncbi:MAG: NUDIX hydrolase [Bacteroidota bacterium]|nr:NUDIX hydrolase [Bacteroidota bacterium]